MAVVRLAPLFVVGFLVASVPTPRAPGEAGPGPTVRATPAPAEYEGDSIASPPEPEPPPAPEVAFAPDVYGVSGVVRTVFALPGQAVALGLRWKTPRPERVRYHWVPVLGTRVGSGSASRSHDRGSAFTVPRDPGIYELELQADRVRIKPGDVRLVVLVPFGEKRRGRIGRYRIGRYPTEGSGRTDRYAPPAGFIEVTSDNRRLRLSEHFRLAEFLTHDQKSVWPKYAIVDPRLLDKLELVLAELEAEGIRAERMVVMSGFRTPQYNRRGLGRGRARLSRHQYGDAADVWVDNDGDWYMDDLDGDGRRNMRDARVMLGAVDRIEARHPELAGGAGVYSDNGAHGPFIHIDARGYRARW